jgi:hypothetical protein
VLTEACPLEGLVRSVASPQETSTYFSFTSNIYAATANSLTLALSLRLKAEINFRIVQSSGFDHHKALYTDFNATGLHPEQSGSSLWLKEYHPKPLR